MSKVEGLNREQLSGLKELLSYDLDPQAVFFSGSHRTKAYLIDKYGKFPTGLLPIVKTWLRGTLHHVSDARIRPSLDPSLFSNYKLCFEPYNEQLEAVRAAKVHCRGTFSMVTGSGKSYTMAMLVKELGLRTLIVVPNLNLKTQLTATFKAIFRDLSNITIENIDSPALATATDYDCLIIDEAHHVAASTYRKLNRKAWTGIYHRYFFTATPYRSNDEEQLLMESISGKIIYTLGYEKAVSQGLVVPMEAYYIDVPKREVEGYTWAQVYNELVVSNVARNQIIGNLIAQLHFTGKSTLTLVKEIKHGEALSELTGAGFANGQNEDCQMLIEAFSAKKLTTLVATTGVAGEGTDTKAAEYIIIAGLGKSKNQFVQQCGRGFRRYPGKETVKVIIFRDLSHKWAKAHFKAQVKILRDEFGVIPVKLPL